MPRYYFHIFNDMEVRDDDGQQLRDVAAARKEARDAAADLIRDEIKAGRKIHPDHRIEIEDERGHMVAVLRFGDLIADERFAGRGRSDEV